MLTLNVVMELLLVSINAFLILKAVLVLSANTSLSGAEASVLLSTTITDQEWYVAFCAGDATSTS